MGALLHPAALAGGASILPQRAPADEDLSVDFSALTTPSDRVAVVVTEPLTADERWNAFAPGELAVFFRDGARMI